MSLIDFLENGVYWTTVDHLWIDTEGTEYSILPELLRGKTLSSENGVEICQINVEFHGPVRDYSFDFQQFDELMRNIINSSDYLPLYVFEPLRHVRAYFVNVKSKYCLTRYFSGRCP